VRGKHGGLAPEWTWFVRGYYADDVKPPKQPGAFAIEVAGVSREALAMDLKILQEREDIGYIEGPFRRDPW
jgi:hypothetical protein